MVFKLSLVACAMWLAAGTTFAVERAQLIPPERLAHYWLLQSASAMQANVPFRGKNLEVPTCAAVAYTIGNDGRTREVKLEKIVPPGDLAKVAVDVVMRMHFAATPQNLGMTPVRTYVAIPFNLPDANSSNAADRAKRAQVLDKCKLDGFGGNSKETVVPIR